MQFLRLNWRSLRTTICQAFLLMLSFSVLMAICEVVLLTVYEELKAQRSHSLAQDCIASKRQRHDLNPDLSDT